MPQDMGLTQAAPSSERRAHIFRLAPPQVNEEAIRELAQRFGLVGNLTVGSLYQDARQLTYGERSFELTLHQESGGLRFHDTARWQVDDGEAHVTFDDDDAVSRAKGYIEEFAVAPLNECQLLRVTRLKVAVAEQSTGVAEERVIDMGVAFQRLVDGIPVFGPGGKVIVYIDHEGSLTGIDRIWREVDDVVEHDVELTSPDTAREEALRHWDEAGSGAVTVDDVRFGYLERGWDDMQDYLQPAYYLPLTITATDGRFAGEAVMRAEHFVPATTSPPEPLIPEPPTVAPPAQRYGDDSR